MAGIGFKLQKLLVEDMYLSLFQGFFYSLVITSGPWLIMVISLAVLSILSSFLLDGASVALFNVLLVHIFAFTIIITGTVQLFFTRVFADRMYTKEREELPVIIISNLFFTLAVTTLLSLPFVSLLQIDFRIKLIVFSLFLTMNLIWVLMNYISASEEFIGFIKHYILGSAGGVLLGATLGFALGFTGFFLGFFLGQGYIASILVIKTLTIFGVPERVDFSFFRTFRDCHVLIISGFCLYAGMWVDKFVYWYGPSGIRFSRLLYVHASYNDVFYLAYLCTTPIMAIFFISMETSFYKRYYAYNKAITARATLNELRNLRNRIILCIHQQLLNIVRIEGLVIIVGVLFAPQLLEIFKIAPDLSRLFIVILCGAFFHMLFLVVCVILLYFDLQRETMRLYALFFMLNLTSTLIAQRLPDVWTGCGYSLSALLVFVVSLRQLKISLAEINYLSFTRHSMAEVRIDEVYLPDTGTFGRYYVRDGKHLISSR